MSASTILEPDVSTKRGKNGGGFGPWIRCPLCGWRPQEHHRWICKCCHVWNVFDTGGVRPGCLNGRTRNELPAGASCRTRIGTSMKKWRLRSDAENRGRAGADSDRD